MSDRLYLFACPAEEAPKAVELSSTPSLLPFEPFVEDGVLYADGGPRANPRYCELSQWANGLPSAYVVKWPSGHLLRLFWKWQCMPADEYKFQARYGDGVYRGRTQPLATTEAMPLLRKQLQRALRAEEITAERAGEIDAFLGEHHGDWLFLDIG